MVDGIMFLRGLQCNEIANTQQKPRIVCIFLKKFLVFVCYKDIMTSVIFPPLNDFL